MGKHIQGSDEQYRAIRRRSQEHILPPRFDFPFDGGPKQEENAVALLIESAWDEPSQDGKVQLEQLRMEYGHLPFWATAFGWATRGRTPAWDGQRPDRKEVKKQNDADHASGKHWGGKLKTSHMPADREAQLRAILGL